MKKKICLLLAIMAITLVHAQEKNLYDFKVTDVDGKEFDMSKLKGKKVLIVNVASKCGLTPQYEQLQQLYDKYKYTGFTIIGFPSNNFKGQEPGSNAEIKEFCTKNYGVTFPIMSKIEVTGDNKAPIYKWLTEKKVNGKLDAEVQWNFQKFMIDEKGNLVDFLAPKSSPLDEKIIKWVEN